MSGFIRDERVLFDMQKYVENVEGDEHIWFTLELYATSLLRRTDFYQVGTKLDETV